MSTKSEPYVQKPTLEPITLVARAREGLYLTDDKANNYLSNTELVICEEASLSMFSSDGDILAVNIYTFFEFDKAIIVC